MKFVFRVGILDIDDLTSECMRRRCSGSTWDEKSPKRGSVLVGCVRASSRGTALQECGPDAGRLSAINGVVFRDPRCPTAMPTKVCPAILNLEEMTWYTRFFERSFAINRL